MTLIDNGSRKNIVGCNLDPFRYRPIFLRFIPVGTLPSLKQELQQMPGAALSDIKVLDLGSHISAPYCAKLLADYGAEVIKVEPPVKGDRARHLGPFPQDIPDAEASGLFLHLNGNKKGVTLDLSSRDGARILKQLVAEADVVVENFPPSFLSSVNLDYDTLEPVNPRLVMTSITPFGRTGPYRDYKATDMGVFAMSGRMYIHGLADRPPLRYAPEISWFQAGATAAVATMGAFFVSKLQNVGQHVDVSAMDTLVNNVDNRPLYYAYTGIKGTRGNWPGGFPQGAYPCKDGYVMFGVGYERFFRRLCHAIGMADLLETPEFGTPEARSEHLEELEALFIGWLMDHDKQEIFETCQRAGVMCAPLLNPGELLEDPQLKARGFFRYVDHPHAGRMAYPGPPFRLTLGHPETNSPAPKVGQHNEEVYCHNLGYSRADLVRLRSAGTI